MCPYLVVDLLQVVSCGQCRGQKELNCVFLQVVKNILELKDEQLAVQMDAQDALWGETGTLFLSVRQI